MTWTESVGATSVLLELVHREFAEASVERRMKRPFAGRVSDTHVCTRTIKRPHLGSAHADHECLELTSCLFVMWAVLLVCQGECIEQ